MDEYKFHVMHILTLVCFRIIKSIMCVDYYCFFEENKISKTNGYSSTCDSLDQSKWIEVVRVIRSVNYICMIDTLSQQT